MVEGINHMLDVMNSLIVVMPLSHGTIILKNKNLNKFKKIIQSGKNTMKN